MTSAIQNSNLVQNGVIKTMEEDKTPKLNAERISSQEAIRRMLEEEIVMESIQLDETSRRTKEKLQQYLEISPNLFFVHSTLFHPDYKLLEQQEFIDQYFQDGLYFQDVFTYTTMEINKGILVGNDNPNCRFTNMKAVDFEFDVYPTKPINPSVQRYTIIMEVPQNIAEELKKHRVTNSTTPHSQLNTFSAIGEKAEPKDFGGRNSITMKNKRIPPAYITAVIYQNNGEVFINPNTFQKMTDEQKHQEYERISQNFYGRCNGETGALKFHYHED